MQAAAGAPRAFARALAPRPLTGQPRVAARGLASRAAAAMDKVSFGSSGASGYEVGPKSSPAVVVLQEWWGVNEIIKEQAQLISAQGFRCLVPDLYRGKIGVDAEEASHLMGNLDFKAAVGELGDAVAYLRSTGSSKVGCLGFCMGGALTFAAAQHAGVDCAAPFYGIPSPEICDPAAIKVPVQAHFGRLDTLAGFSDPESAEAVVSKMRAAGAPVELFMYEGSGHAFMNALTEQGRAKIKEIGQAEPPEAEPKLAFERLVEFLRKHLLA